MDEFLITEAEATEALEQDGMTLEDYDSTILGMVNNGTWQVLEDSLQDEEEALDWARRVASYGEHVGLFVWTPCD